MYLALCVYLAAAIAMRIAYGFGDEEGNDRLHDLAAVLWPLATLLLIWAMSGGGVDDE